MIMGANGLHQSAIESKEDSEFPYEICINDSEIKTKGKLRLFGDWGGGLVVIGCITMPYCHPFFFTCTPAVDEGTKQL